MRAEQLASDDDGTNPNGYGVNDACPPLNKTVT